MVEEMRPVGRPTNFSQELADKICDRVAEGNSLRKICLADNMPCMAAIFNWLSKYPQFVEQYESACQERGVVMAEKSLDEAYEAKGLDAPGVSAQKLIVDTLKWHASKLAPKRYGDKVQQEIVGRDGGAVEVLSKIERVIVDPSK